MYQSQFIEMFGDPITNPLRLPTRPLKEVAPESPSKHECSGKVWNLNLDMIESNTSRIIEKIYQNGEALISVLQFDTGNVLYSKLRPYLNKVVIPDEIGYATTELVPLRPNTDLLHPVFLLHLLRSDSFVNYANTIATGTKMPRMPMNSIRSFKCILPQMDEQRRFVEIAEQADKSKFSGLKSQFIEMFVSSPIVKLGDEISTQSGGTPNTKKQEYYEGGNIPWLSSGEVNQGYISSTEKYITQEGLDNSSAKWVPKNSVLIAMYGATAGKVGFSTIPLTTNQAVCALLPCASFDPIFLYYAVSQKSGWMISQCRGAAQPNISQGIIRSMELPKPSMVKQKQFVTIAEQADKSKQVAYSLAS